MGTSDVKIYDGDFVAELTYDNKTVFYARDTLQIICTFDMVMDTFEILNKIKELEKCSLLL